MSGEDLLVSINPLQTITLQEFSSDQTTKAITYNGNNYTLPYQQGSVAPISDTLVTRNSQETMSNKIVSDCVFDGNPDYSYTVDDVEGSVIPLTTSVVILDDEGLDLGGIGKYANSLISSAGGAYIYGSYIDSDGNTLLACATTQPYIVYNSDGTQFISEAGADVVGLVVKLDSDGMVLWVAETANVNCRAIVTNTAEVIVFSDIENVAPVVIKNADGTTANTLAPTGSIMVVYDFDGVVTKSFIYTDNLTCVPTGIFYDITDHVYLSLANVTDPSTFRSFSGGSTVINNVDSIMVKYLRTGEFVYGIALDGTPGQQQFRAVTVDNTTGEIYICVTYNGGTTAVLYNEDGSVFYTTPVYAGTKQSFLAKFDLIGVGQWVQLCNGDNVGMLGVTVTPGRIIVSIYNYDLASCDVVMPDTSIYVSLDHGQGIYVFDGAAGIWSLTNSSDDTEFADLTNSNIIVDQTSGRIITYCTNVSGVVTITSSDGSAFNMFTDATNYAVSYDADGIAQWVVYFIGASCPSFAADFVNDYFIAPGNTVGSFVGVLNSNGSTFKVYEPIGATDANIIAWTLSPTAPSTFILNAPNPVVPHLTLTFIANTFVNIMLDPPLRIAGSNIMNISLRRGDSGTFIYSSHFNFWSALYYNVT